MPKALTKSKKSAGLLQPQSRKARPAKTSSRETKPTEDPLSPARVAELLRRLDATYPTAVCALHHNSAWELLIATILSAQCTDERVNMVTPVIFKKYPTVKHFAAIQPEELE